jgi:hypothetical protein
LPIAIEEVQDVFDAENKEDKKIYLTSLFLENSKYHYYKKE